MFVGPAARFANRSLFLWVAGMLLLTLPMAVSMSSMAMAQDEKKEEAATEEAPAEEKADAPAPEEEAAKPPEKSALKWLLDASGPFGLLIIVLSFLLIGFIITDVMLFRRSNFIPQDLVDGIEQKLAARDLAGAYELAKKDESFCGKVLAGGMSRLNKGYEEAAAGMSEVADDENMVLDHKLSYISLIGSVAPMLGLLGTVQGMVQAFNIIAASSTSPKPNELAEGIVLALVTTLEGLVVAIPAIVGFALFKNAQARLVHDSLAVADNFIQRILGKKAGPAAAAAPAAPTA